MQATEIQKLNMMNNNGYVIELILDEITMKFQALGTSNSKLRAVIQNIKK